jgi:hypothetical protein
MRIVTEEGDEIKRSRPEGSRSLRLSDFQTIGT